MTADKPTGASSPGDGQFVELRSGDLGVRVATTLAEIDAAQALRFKVFYEELGATPIPEAVSARRDRDAFDEVADHLLVVDHSIGPGAEGVIATYRLIREEAAERIGRFYSADEYDLSMVRDFPGRVMELGRSCVDPGYRGKAAMQLLWRGIAAYVSLHRIDLMFGCASLPGTDPEALAVQLSYLHLNHLAPPNLRPRALPRRYVNMRRLDPSAIPERAASTLPPLIKGYLRLGGFVGDGAVIDEQFNTTDVAVIVMTDLVTEKYLRRFERQSRDAAD